MVYERVVNHDHEDQQAGGVETVNFVTRMKERMKKRKAGELGQRTSSYHNINFDVSDIFHT